jgi:hypothetical protein
VAAGALARPGEHERQAFADDIARPVGGPAEARRDAPGPLEVDRPVALGGPPEAALALREEQVDVEADLARDGEVAQQRPGPDPAQVGEAGGKRPGQPGVEVGMGVEERPGEEHAIAESAIAESKARTEPRVAVEQLVVGLDRETGHRGAHRPIAVRAAAYSAARWSALRWM